MRVRVGGGVQGGKYQHQLDVLGQHCDDVLLEVVRYLIAQGLALVPSLAFACLREGGRKQRAGHAAK